VDTDHPTGVKISDQATRRRGNYTSALTTPNPLATTP
jgi:hypothetical protein